jgi:hypothetical protein
MFKIAELQRANCVQDGVSSLVYDRGFAVMVSSGED